MTLTTICVERGFSRINIIKTKGRVTMLTQTLHQLLNLKLNSSSLHDQARIHWKEKGRRKIKVVTLGTSLKSFK